MKCFLLTLLVCLAAWAGGPGDAAAATTYLVGNASQFNAAANTAQPGDQIVIRNGSYNQSFTGLSINAHGTELNPIVIRPETPHGVTFTGNTNNARFTLTGSHLELRGFDFSNVRTDGPAVVNVAGSHNRVAANRFLGGGHNNTQGTIIMVQATAHHARIDHNYFRAARSVAVSTINTDTQGAQHTRIDHNIFRDFARLSTNGQEPIQLGSAPATRHAIAQHALVEYNLFDNTNADTEIISNKSSYNTIRHNVFANSPDAELTIRGGTHALVDGNIIVNNARGMVLFGSDHTVTNNVIVGASHWGIEISNGIDTEQTPSSQWPSTVFDVLRRSVIAHNTLINPGARAIYLRQTSGRGEDKPFENTITNNLIVLDGQWNGIDRIAFSDTVEAASLNTLAPNLLQLTGGAVAGTDTASQLLAPAGLLGPPEAMRLTAGSAAIDAATASTITHDAFGNPRPLGNHPDMGHHEFGGNAEGYGNLLYVPPVRGGGGPLAADVRSFEMWQVVGQPILFDAAFSTGNISQFQFDFGDGTTVAGAEMVAAHAWNKPGLYQVTVTATAGGNHHTDTFNIQIIHDPRIFLGDANRDGRVDHLDLIILAEHWKQDGRSFAEGNFDYHGLIDEFDLALLAAHWGAGTEGDLPSFAAALSQVRFVPEPTSLVLLLLAAAIPTTRPRRGG